MSGRTRHYDVDSDAALLDLLTGPVAPTAKTILPRRDAALDPLLIAAAAASGPHVTRNHYHHDFFPGVMLPKAEGSWDWTKFTGEDATSKSDRRRFKYVSRQAPRKSRPQQTESLTEHSKENGQPHEDPLRSLGNLPPQSPKERRLSLASTTDAEVKSWAKPLAVSEQSTLEVKCMARTRIPTPHGPVFLHLYHNNRDNKEHLAVVVDPAQLSDDASAAPPIRSRSLDTIWSETETEMDRITRGAYVGKLSPTSQHASVPPTSRSKSLNPDIPPPLIRLHSECFTGETVGSMRCDCGEQLDEAIRLISQPINLPSKTIPGRGAVIYLRQEGRGIGLLSKIRAYNLQDLGYDTVAANLMLGHQADERGYEIACAILRDLGLGVASELGEGVRVLTNNPDKVKALESEGIRVVERVPMVPRSWKARNTRSVVEKGDTENIVGATLIGGNAVYGKDLDNYLKTKVLKMGHILPLWLADPQQ
ncbi:GTP cyclohydrolase II-domain-containing protein [Mycena floridula]|nr:GTP cyclohydrolase II-domain-containing protein [Mycena floridula]